MVFLLLALVFPKIQTAAIGCTLISQYLCSLPSFICNKQLNCCQHRVFSLLNFIELQRERHSFRLPVVASCWRWCVYFGDARGTRDGKRPSQRIAKATDTSRPGNDGRLQAKLRPFLPAIPVSFCCLLSLGEFDGIGFENRCLKTLERYGILWSSNPYFDDLFGDYCCQVINEAIVRDGLQDTVRLLASSKTIRSTSR